MTKTKHTLGPWILDTTGKYYPKDVVRHNGVVVCRVAPKDRPGQTPGESAANARLIVSAPDLLEACKNLVQAHNVGMGPGAIALRIDLARVALAKAEEAPLAPA